MSVNAGPQSATEHPLNDRRLNKVLTRILTDDETGAIVARNVLLAALKSAGLDPRNVTILTEEYAYRTIQRQQDWNERLHGQLCELQDEVASLKGKLLKANRKSKAEKIK